MRPENCGPTEPPATINMVDYIVGTQTINDPVQFHLEGYFLCPKGCGNGDTIEHTGYSKTAWIDSNKFVLTKTSRGGPAELYLIDGNNVYLTEEMMDWITNNEYRDHHDPKTRMPNHIWGLQKITPSQDYLEPNIGDFSYRYCDSGVSNYVNFHHGGFYVLLYDLNTKTVEQIETDLVKRGLTTPLLEGRPFVADEWKQLRSTLGHDNGQNNTIIIRVNVWGPLGEKTGRSLKNWRDIELYTYLHDVGLVSWQASYHEKPNDPFIIIKRLTLDKIVFDDGPMPWGICEQQTAFESDSNYEKPITKYVLEQQGKEN